MKRSPTLGAVALVLFMVFGSAFATRADAAPAVLNIPIVQALPGVGTFTGNLAITQFKEINGVLNAIGTLTGQITNLAGVPLGTIGATLLQIPVGIPEGGAACDILHLTLGPLDLNLLGLVVHLDQIKLDITAQPGPGNLLGNLLCDIAGLLDKNPLGNLAGILNRLLNPLG